MMDGLTQTKLLNGMRSCEERLLLFNDGARRGGQALVGGVVVPLVEPFKASREM